MQYSKPTQKCLSKRTRDEELQYLTDEDFKPTPREETPEPDTFSLSNNGLFTDMLTAPTTNAKEVRIRTLSDFMGERTKMAKFLQEVKLYM